MQPLGHVVRVEQPLGHERHRFEKPSAVGTNHAMTPVQLVLIVVCIAVIGVAIAMINDVFNELDRRRLNEEISAAARRLRQRTG
jgi:hypothetical protein